MSKEREVLYKNAKYVVRFLKVHLGGKGGKDEMASYQEVRLFAYDEVGKLIVERELLFRCNPGFIVPRFETYEEIRKFWSYPNHARLEVQPKTIYDIREI